MPRLLGPTALPTSARRTPAGTAGGGDGGPPAGRAPCSSKTPWHPLKGLKQGEKHGWVGGEAMPGSVPGPSRLELSAQPAPNVLQWCPAGEWAAPATPPSHVTRGGLCLTGRCPQYTHHRIEPVPRSRRLLAGRTASATGTCRWPWGGKTWSGRSWAASMASPSTSASLRAGHRWRLSKPDQMTCSSPPTPNQVSGPGEWCRGDGGDASPCNAVPVLQAQRG